MKTKRDPALEEVRAARMALSARFGHDVKKLCDYLREQQKKHTGRVIKRPEDFGKHSKIGRAQNRRKVVGSV